VKKARNLAPKTEVQKRPTTKNLKRFMPSSPFKVVNELADILKKMSEWKILEKVSE